MADWIFALTSSLCYTGFGVHMNSLCKEYPDKTASFDKIREAALHGILPGFEWGCDIMFMIAFVPRISGVGLIIARLIHIIGGYIVLVVALGSQESANTHQNFLENALGAVTNKFSKVLRENMDTQFAFESHAWSVRIMGLMVLSELTMIPFLPWKVSHEYTASQGYPSNELLTLCLYLKGFQCLISFCTLIGISCTEFYGPAPAAFISLVVVYMLSMLLSIVLLLKKLYDLHYDFDAHANRLAAETPSAIKDMMASMEDGSGSPADQGQNANTSNDNRQSEFGMDSIYSGGNGIEPSSHKQEEYDVFGFPLDKSSGEIDRNSTFTGTNPLMAAGGQLPDTGGPVAPPSGKIEIRKVRRASAAKPQLPPQEIKSLDSAYDDVSTGESSDEEGNRKEPPKKSFTEKALDHIDKHVNKIGDKIDRMSENISNTYGHRRNSTEKAAIAAAAARAQDGPESETTESYGIRHKEAADEPTDDAVLHAHFRKSKDEKPSGDEEFHL